VFCSQDPFLWGVQKVGSDGEVRAKELCRPLRMVLVWQVELKQAEGRFYHAKLCCRVAVGQTVPLEIGEEVGRWLGP